MGKSTDSGIKDFLGSILNFFPKLVIGNSGKILNFSVPWIFHSYNGHNFYLIEFLSVLI